MKAQSSVLRVFRRIRSNTPILLLCVMGFVFAAGTTGYMFIEQWNFFDSLYMTIITVFTIGFSEIHPLSFYGRVFTIGLIFLGVGSLSYTVTIIAQSILHSEILYQRLNLRKIRAMNNHYIICGYGRIGHRIASEVQSLRKDFVVIDQNPDTRKTLKELGIPHIIGDATSEEVLEQAGIRVAKGLVSALSDDALNVFVTLTARGLNPDLHIVARSDVASTVPKLIRAGANKVASPYDSGAARLTLMLLQTSIIDTFQLATGKYSFDVVIEEFIIIKESIIGRTLADIDVRSIYNAMALAIVAHDGKLFFPPDPAYILQRNDRLIIALSHSQLDNLIQFFRVP